MATELFYAEYFDWTLRGQIVLLSRAGAAPPALEYEHVERLFGASPVDRRSTGLPLGFSALLAPGVDGDFMELIALDEKAGDALCAALARVCAQAHVGWKVVLEAEFMQTRWQ